MTRWTQTALLAVSALLATCATAYAGTVSVSGDTVVFTASPGEANALTFQFTFRTNLAVLVRDTGASLEMGPGCVAVDGRALCVNDALDLRRVSISAGDRNDSATITGGAVEFHGGTGDDVVKASLWNDQLYGDSGNDQLHGASGDDRLYGGDGNDSLSGGAGGDILDGGAGADDMRGGENGGGGGDPPGPFDDAVLYTTRTANLHVTLDGIADDGEAGEGDNVAADVEQVAGGSGDDTLDASTGGRDANHTLGGGAGNDSLIGGDGEDRLLGGDGNDVLQGNGWVDSLDGGDGNDVLYGGDFYDYIGGGAGDDQLFGGAGDDHMGGEYDTGNDQVEGGPGNDTLRDSPGSDVMHGGDNEDVFEAGLSGGIDEFFGDAGIDRWDGGFGNAALSVRLDDLPNDGTAGDLDNVRTDIEAVQGSRFNDMLVGNDAVNTLEGRYGNDTLIGNGGRDVLAGDQGADTLLGRDGGPDWLDCGEDNDSVQFDAGVDVDVRFCEVTLP